MYVLATTKTGLRVVLLRDRGFGVAAEVLMKRLEERGIRVERVEELNFLTSVIRMEEILAEERVKNDLVAAKR